jgi:hypothetical protein
MKIKILCLQITDKRMKYPLTTIEIATAQKKDHQIYSKECKNIKSGFACSTY